MLDIFGTNGPPLRQKNEVTGPLFLKFFAGSWNQSVQQNTVRLYLGQALPEQSKDEAHDFEKPWRSPLPKGRDLDFWPC